VYIYRVSEYRFRHIYRHLLSNTAVLFDVGISTSQKNRGSRYSAHHYWGSWERMVWIMDGRWTWSLPCIQSRERVAGVVNGPDQ